ncbi:MAG TPA: hypothetical protein VF735_08975 [Pyrinomonadaceae bacterium]|jgi:hypothetical protein
MFDGLQTTQPAAEFILARRELLSLDRASTYLAGRARVRTPLGAAEFIGVAATHGQLTYDKRVHIALRVMSIFRESFPEEYARSQAPLYSTEREHEFYRLVNKRLFPLCLSADLEDELESNIASDPYFFLEYIPVRGTQQHNWLGGCCPFQKLQTVFKVVLVLSGHSPDGWTALARHYGLTQEASPPLAAYGWTHFLYSCAVEETPLRHLPLAFHMVCYKTGNPWLDLPTQAGRAGFEWTHENVAWLLYKRAEAEAMNYRVGELDRWLDEDAGPRIARAVELWNEAAALERESGFEGMLDTEIFTALMGRAEGEQ